MDLKYWYHKVLLKICRTISPLLRDDEFYLRLYYYCGTGHKLHLDAPKRFTEKLQWLKLYYRKPEFVDMVDKYSAKEVVKKIIGEDYIIPSLGVWEHFDNIDFDQLPNQFVLKTTHDQGGVIVVKDKKELDKVKAKDNFEKRLTRKFYAENREWPYSCVRPRIMAEVYMEDKTIKSTDLTDYKFFCFGGKPHYCQVIRNRHSGETIDFYDINWEHQDFVGLNPVASNGREPVARPENLDEMVDVCMKLSQGHPFIRVDLYVVNNKVYFGELTFYPASGKGVFTPDIWDMKLGDMLALPVS